MKNITESHITQGMRVLVRGDLDVPLENGEIKDTNRLDNIQDTLLYIKEHGGKSIIMGHMGRPKGAPNPSLSTSQLKPYFDHLLGTDNYELLENLRFDPREKENSEELAHELAEKADIYVNEAFGTCHREHASITGVPHFLPSYSGVRLQKEIDTLSKVRSDPERPLILIVGGVKIEDKLPVINSFLDSAKWILIGGKAGMDWQRNIPENVILPKDYAQDGFDIGPKTIAQYKDLLQEAKTVIWAGPLGKFEEKEFFTGTREIADTIADLTTQMNCFSVIGGGDTLNAVKKAGVKDKISFASSGGGAMLKFLAGEQLPGIVALE